MNSYRIAELNTGMDTWGLTLERAEKWRTQAPSSYDVVIPAAACENSLEEYQRTEAAFNAQLLQHNGLLLHASAIVFQGKAYCFSGPSGSGKSTQTSLWKAVFPDRVQVLNDDKPALRLMHGTWYAFGTPWSGKTDQSLNQFFPLGGIFLVRHWHQNQVDRVTTSYNITQLSACMSGPLNGVQRYQSILLLDSLIKAVPIWSLSCLPNEEAVQCTYQAILKEAQNNL